jgi:hypothetical protein
MRVARVLRMCEMKYVELRWAMKQMERLCDSAREHSPPLGLSLRRGVSSSDEDMIAGGRH